MTLDLSQLDAWQQRLGAAPRRVAGDGRLVVTRGAKRIESTAQSLAPVDDGELRSGITTDPVEQTATSVETAVRSTARHARFVEYGTVDTAPQPHMRPAADRHRGGIVDEIQRVVVDALRR